MAAKGLVASYLFDLSCFHGTFCGRNHFQDHETLLLSISFQKVGHGHCELLLGDALTGPLGLPSHVHPPHALKQSGDHLWGKSFPHMALRGQVGEKVRQGASQMRQDDGNIAKGERPTTATST